MDTTKLKKFAQFARRSLIEQVSAKLKFVLADNSAARRERAEGVQKLEQDIKDHGREQVVERVAYIWFNRFCALRFMDVNRYNRANVVSPADRRFFSKAIKPNICVLKNVRFSEGELGSYMAEVGRELFTAPVRATLHQFEEADNFGSLIRPQDINVAELLQALEQKDFREDWLHKIPHQKALQALRQADYLSPKYHAVIANPPYMGGKGMNGRLAAWAKDNYPDSKSDLFAMFIERGLELVPKYGYSAMVTMQSWMFLSSYESLRSKLMAQTAMRSMAHMGNMVMGIAFGTAATVWTVESDSRASGFYCYVEYEDLDEDNKPALFPPHNGRNLKAPSQDLLYRASADDFQKIPGGPIAYWVSAQLRSIFASGHSIEQIAPVRQGFQTGNNDLFLRLWYEVDFMSCGFGFRNTQDFHLSEKLYAPYNKGGEFRKWYGNNDYLVAFDQENYGKLSQLGNKLPSRHLYFKDSITWSSLSSGSFGARYNGIGFTFSAKGACAFPGSTRDRDVTLSLLNSSVCKRVLEFLSPTIDFNVGSLRQIPLPTDLSPERNTSLHENCSRNISIGILDWDSSEISWDFKYVPLLNLDYRQSTLTATYHKLRAHWREVSLEMQRLEEENNRIFIETYGLQDELTPEVPLNEITLTCNPHYRYGGDKSEDELEALLLADTMRELVSYAVGCMFGRYSLDMPGLVLANQGETAEDYSIKHNKALNWGIPANGHDDLERLRDATVENCSFLPDEDNVIPMLDGDWFPDDIVERFRKFLRVTFGDEHYEENLEFVEQALNIKNKRSYSIRDYFLDEFYSDHVKRYKKRPIYWLFSSPKGSFNALIYMHRYRPDTVSVVLNDYLREFRTKLASQKKHLEAVSISADASAGDKTKALKEIEKLTKTITELEEYERDVLYPLATQQVEIDLDDGVKVNYPKFGAALKRIVGLDAKED